MTTTMILALVKVVEALVTTVVEALVTTVVEALVTTVVEALGTAVVEALGTAAAEALVMMLVSVTTVVVVDLEIAVVLAAAMEVVLAVIVVGLGEASDKVEEMETEEKAALNVGRKGICHENVHKVVAVVEGDQEHAINVVWKDIYHEIVQTPQVMESHQVGVVVLVVDLEGPVVVLGLQMALLTMIRTANHLDLVVVLDDHQEVLGHPMVLRMRMTIVSHLGLKVGLVMDHQQMKVDLVVGLVVVMKIRLEVVVLVDVQGEMIHVEFVNKVAILQEIALINHQEMIHAEIVVKVVILLKIVLMNQKLTLTGLHL